ncbi:putative zinc finger protein [Hamiltosporidium tvaerminnensis]|uniref:Putative zinc finger protein n=2 Tax=Hamiltosporidium TaxID=1176354 RepID=A0A4Q9LPH6_9MICR|nr:AN1-type zinc finger protein 6 [Hamiltosporidium tvaerminnensis]TBU09425.1 putative zinc finger protein [Hamiltosporidium magnivora]TBU04438.1 putative zinc finger protein [Hamiltosporidium tvaerminnensis]TBU09430.1 putative zinc finger protein [Hamiltosporidium magnivora]TBU12445.1 putative zinc finger protein [Hamiltosporidium tvaerminnensis]
MNKNYVDDKSEEEIVERTRKRKINTTIELQLHKKKKSSTSLILPATLVETEMVKNISENSTEMICAICKRKLRVSNNFSCRCGGMFCGRHRHFDQHSCTYDIRKDFVEKLTKENPRIIGRKLNEF